MSSSRIRTAFLPLLICLLAADGCRDRTPTIRHLNPDAVIVAFGDSLTSGEGAAESENYPAVLSKITGYKVVNAGVSGELSADGRQRLPGLLQSLTPDLVILCHGGNDILQKSDIPAMAENLQAMVTAIREAGADVILLGVPRPGLRLKSLPIYRDIARQYRVPCDMKAIPEILSQASLKSDYVHPNAKGYRRLAEAVAALIRQSQR